LVELILVEYKAIIRGIIIDISIIVIIIRIRTITIRYFVDIATTTSVVISNKGDDPFTNIYGIVDVSNDSIS
jgi:hypothetical protein